MWSAALVVGGAIVGIVIGALLVIGIANYALQEAFRRTF